MSKLAHSNDETMREIERKARAEEGASDASDAWPAGFLPLRTAWSMVGRTLVMDADNHQAIRPRAEVGSSSEWWETESQWEQAAPRIVRAVNAYDGLVAALESLLAEYDDERGVIDVRPDPHCLECTRGLTPYELDHGLCPRHKAEAAIAKAKAKGE